MDKVTFYKMSGSGNDFIIIDNRTPTLPLEPKRFVPQVCHRRLSVGADGVLLIEKSSTADFRMRYYNADGGEAEMCGNGGRCIARLASQLGIAGETMRMETPVGVLQAEVRGSRVKLQMPPPHSLRLGMDITVEGTPYKIHAVNTGVPHAVLFCPDAEQIPVTDLGRPIRHHPAFQPAGTNVDFVSVLSPTRLRLRTYERGVEEETLACGTGAVASAVVAAALGKGEPPIAVEVRSGEVLTVHFTRAGETVTNVFFEGEVRLAYQGEMTEEAWSY